MEPSVRSPAICLRGPSDYPALVPGMKAKYGIIYEDMYNFDEFGFLMGKISSQLVVTGSEKPGKRKKLQPSDHE
ncbi:hypothetical protein AA0119_g13201 [Alternaria tenuissima]|uniref:Uncharacterized protein n=1 Tax=Alternaria tenuissima TaxID=119927 RepID=A0ABY0FRI5_9PLEO|nr:hypothetical protein AA0119_g13201 [Alternaria tenuissima]RYO02603.1 hypothetical protein AA0121_g13253 [Alternaria tenuissima]RYO45345.1 hypothetical protein AA0116_g13300 [Alternaria tenuissima]